MADLPTGPDNVHGGDGLPDWMQFTITVAIFGLFIWIIWLLFHSTLDDKFRDLMNIIVGGFLYHLVKLWIFGLNTTKIRNQVV